MPKISIITTTYKHQDFIAETIESILAQIFTDWELLIWDDSPDDETWNIIQEYVSKFPDKIKAWHHSPNKWIVNNMNFLLEKASNKSEYIAFLEWDDMFTSDNLQEKLKIFEKYKEVKMVYNNLDFIDEESNVIRTNYLQKAPFYIKNSTISEETFIENENFYISYSTLMINKKTLDEIKIINPTTNKLYSVSDWDLFYKISTKYKCYWIEKSLTLYRKHSRNFSGNIIWLLDDFEVLLKTYLKDNNKTLIEKKIWYLYLLKSVQFLTINKKYAIKNLFQSIKYNVFSYFKYKTLTFFMIFLPKNINKLILEFYRKKL